MGDGNRANNAIENLRLGDGNRTLATRPRTATATSPESCVTATALAWVTCLGRAHVGWFSDWPMLPAARAMQATPATQLHPATTEGRAS